VQAIRQGLADGTIDVIATDHAPHSEDEKKVEFDKAPFGISGLETALQLSLQLVEQDVISLEDMISKLTNIPATIIGSDKGTLKKGAQADIVVFNTEDEVVINRNNFYSKGKNTPFHDWKVKGKVNYTIVNGRIVYKNL
jgi:dihydroorotase